MFTLAEENYLKTIFHLSTDARAGISTNAIAKKLDTKASSVTDMMKKLAEKKVVDYQKYQGVKLTELGKKTAANIIRKHRLWEVFLVEKLNFAWDEVHDVAEQLEHIKSAKLIDELDAFLQHPKKDPHGDPIPDKDGNLQVVEKRLLIALSMGESGICIGVQDSSAEFLRFMDRNGIALGQRIKVLDKEPFDDSLYIEVNGRSFSISEKIAANLYIEQ